MAELVENLELLYDLVADGGHVRTQGSNAHHLRGGGIGKDNPAVRLLYSDPIIDAMQNSVQLIAGLFQLSLRADPRCYIPGNSDRTHDSFIVKNRYATHFSHQEIGRFGEHANLVWSWDFSRHRLSKLLDR